MVQKKNPRLSELQKQLAKQAKPAKLAALKRSLTRKANKTQLKPGMHTLGEFKDATSMALSDKFPYGKYKDKTLRYIIKTDPMWLSWIMQNNDSIRLCAAAQKEMEMFAIADSDGLIECDQVTLEEGEWGGIAIEDTF